MSRPKETLSPQIENPKRIKGDNMGDFGSVNLVANLVELVIVTTYGSLDATKEAGPC